MYYCVRVDLFKSYDNDLYINIFSYNLKINRCCIYTNWLHYLVIRRLPTAAEAARDYVNALNVRKFMYFFFDDERARHDTRLSAVSTVHCMQHVCAKNRFTLWSKPIIFNATMLLLRASPQHEKVATSSGKWLNSQLSSLGSHSHLQIDTRTTTT